MPSSTRTPRVISEPSQCGSSSIGKSASLRSSRLQDRALPVAPTQPVGEELADQALVELNRLVGDQRDPSAGEVVAPICL